MFESFWWFIGVGIGVALSLLSNGALVWIICWALNGIGIYSIGPFAVTFSWPLTFLFTVAWTIFKTLSSKKD